ncbi:DUF2968 domain-containing protein [Imbroritus primus]|uniref:DUF2968 domain-containing protein n=1 Tax=Imbroritus primus TaxID=3058603 RepID=UPI003D1621CC
MSLLHRNHRACLRALPAAAALAMALAAPQLHAQIAPAAATPAAATPPAAPVAPAAGGTVHELQQLIQSQKLVEMRTAYNGNFGTSMLYHPEKMTFYVAMFQQKNFWRVVKTTSRVRADAVFRDFNRETDTMAQAELKIIQLDAQKDMAEKSIAESEARLRGLEADLAIQRQQEQQARALQQAANEQAKALDVEQRAMRMRLNELQRRIDTLEAQTNAVQGKKR